MLRARNSRSFAAALTVVGVLIAAAPADPALATALSARATMPAVTPAMGTPAVGTLVARPATAVPGESVRVSGRAPRQGRNATVALQRRDSTGRWRTTARARADATGLFTITLRAAASGRTVLRAVGVGVTPGYTLRPIAVTTVVPRLLLVATAAVARVDVVASLVPARGRRTVVLQDRRGNAWVDVAQGRTTTTGSVTLRWTSVDAGPRRLRAAVAAGAGLPAVTSAWQRVRVPAAPSAPPPPTSKPPTSVPPPVVGPTADTVRVVAAAGLRQFLDCRGQGTPTMVLVSGRYGWSKDWSEQVGALRARTRVCTYDRPGLGQSPARPRGTVVDAGVHARELAALLSAAGERGPFLLVAHSYGGQIARAFVHQRRDDVAGLMLLDSVPAYWQDIDPAYPRQREEAGSIINSDASSAALGGRAALAGLPLVVVTAGRSRTGESAALQSRWEYEEHTVALASTDSLELLVPRAGHQLQVYAPQVTLQSALTLLGAVRARSPLPGCPGDWAALQARCIPRS